MGLGIRFGLRGRPPGTLALDGSVPLTGLQNEAYTGQLTASGGTAPYTYSKTGTLPTGVSLNASTGALSGSLSALGTFTFTGVVTDNAAQTATSGSYPVVVAVAPFAWPDSTNTGHLNESSYPGSLTTWAGAQTISSTGAGATSGNGTALNPWVYAYIDFVRTTNGGMVISGSHLRFVGCRFQSNSSQNVRVTGTDVTFSYCSVVPNIAISGVSVPPNYLLWPAAGTGLTTAGAGTGFLLDNALAYQYGFNLISGGPVTIDHCNIWGGGNLIVLYNTTAQMTITNNWIHDCADGAAPNLFHQDGVGYLNGATPPQNVTIEGNTIASVGNTNGLAFQAATSAYANIIVRRNYFSGFNYVCDFVHNVSGSNNLTFTDNVFGTDLPWFSGPIYTNITTLMQQATNTWARNTLKYLAGTAPLGTSYMQWTAGDDGKYIWPDRNLHAADFS